MTVSQFGIDLSGFKKRESEEIVGMEHYDNDEEGVSVELFQGYLMNVVLGPRKSDDALRCNQPSRRKHEEPVQLVVIASSHPLSKAGLKFHRRGSI
jgi:hypothetical protein